MFSRVELGEFMGLSAEILDKINEEPHSRELQMVIELLNSGSNEEIRRLAQALLEIERQVL